MSIFDSFAEISSSTEVRAAIVAAFTSLVTLAITLFTKNAIEKKLLLFKLNEEHKFEQRKQIKKVLSNHKSHLLEACENLNHRLWNLSSHENHLQASMNGDYSDASRSESYYFHSLAYRILAMYAWIRKLQKELIHFDASVATKSDFSFIKYLRFYGIIFSDNSFYRGFEFRRNEQYDHIYKNTFDELSLNVIEKNQVISYNDYLEKIPKIEDKLLDFYRFLDGISPREERLRWERIQILKVFNIAFLNEYGYDYQKTSNKKLKEAILVPRKSEIYRNFQYLLKRQKLNKDQAVREVCEILNEVENTIPKWFSREWKLRLNHSLQKIKSRRMSFIYRTNASEISPMFYVEFQIKNTKLFKAKLPVIIYTESEDKAKKITDQIKASLEDQDLEVLFINKLIAINENSLKIQNEIIREDLRSRDTGEIEIKTFEITKAPAPLLPFAHEVLKEINTRKHISTQTLNYIITEKEKRKLSKPIRFSVTLELDQSPLDI